MNSTQQLLLHRVSRALFGTPDTTPLPDEVLAEAKAQAILSLISNDFPAIVANIRCTAAHAELSKVLADLPFTTFKGYASAYYYPKPENRTMGDVDFIVAPEHYQEALDRLLQAGWSSVEHSCDHHEMLRKGETIFELHWKVNGVPDDPEAKVNLLLADLVDTAVRVETPQGAIMIPDEFHHGLVMLLHVAHHMTESKGIGLRHLCDWAVYVNRVDLEKYRDRLAEAGLWTFARQLTAVSSAYLGMPPKPWAGEWSKAFLEEIIDDFLSAGNFGRKESGRVQAQKMEKSFLKMTEEKVPISRKHPVLLPFAAVFHFVRYGFRILTGKAKIVKLSTLTRAKERSRLYEQFQLFREDKQSKGSK